MNSKESSLKELSWEDLDKMICSDENLVNGPTNSQAKLRLFGQPEKNLRVTLYRDHHAWCPYCQKVWLWLEWKKIPYQVKKVTMRCYGKKERWYLNKVPSGLLPALEVDGRLLTESDLILLTLEEHFGPLGNPLNSPKTIELRVLERKLFRAWCQWLCTPRLNPSQEKQRRKEFQKIAKEVELRMSTGTGPWMDSKIDQQGKNNPGSGDLIFIPYIERMNASLAYYKGLSLRKEFPLIDRWFQALEGFEEYRGTQGDFHTHAHDLPPQMGGCWKDPNPEQKRYERLIDCGEGLGEQETSWIVPKNIQAESIALGRVLKHRERLLELNPLGPQRFDQPLRASLTLMMTNKICSPESGSALGLRYLRDRISVPRDMPLIAARKLRTALEITAQIDGSTEGPPIPFHNRFDQDPYPFQPREIS